METTALVIGLVFSILTGVMGLFLGVVSLFTSFAVIVRLFTKTEVRVDRLAVDVEKVDTLSRATHDDFNGRARNAHTELAGKVLALEAAQLKLATVESVTTLTTELRLGLRHIASLIAVRLGTKDEHDQDGV